MFQVLARATARMCVIGVVGATIGVAGVTAGPMGIPSAGASSSAMDPNPYLPSDGHAYRHGAVPTKGQQGKIDGWNAQHRSSRPAGGATGPDTLYFSGGIGTQRVAAVTATPKVYLVFWGNQWGTQSTDANGNITFSADHDHGAPYIQQLFKGLGTNSELWSGTMTQYCDGPLVSVSATSCPPGAPHVGYPGGAALAGVWYDNSAAEPSPASYSQIAAEAVAAATHFGNSSSSSNRYVQYVVLSAPGTDPDSYLTSNFCAWHDWESSSVGNLAFTNMPYVMDVGYSCGAGFVNSPGTLDGYSIVEGHEYAETVTDEFPNNGWLSNAPGNVGSEVGDECAWIAPGNSGGAANVALSTGSFAMQSTWSNDTNTCAISHPVVTGSSANTVTVTNPGAQTGTAGTATGLQVQTSDSATNATISYSATGLPAGLSMNSSSGVISGTPTTANTYIVTVTATDNTGANGSSTFSWTINPSTNVVSVTSPVPQNSTAGTHVSLQIQASDTGTGTTLTYGATGLPAGLSITSSGLISGTPNSPDTYTVTVTARDQYGAQGSASFSWTVGPSGSVVTVTNPGSQASTTGTRVSLAIHATDSAGATLTYSASGLPAGLTINKSTGLISGTPNTAASYSVMVTVTDTTGSNGSASFAWTVQRKHH
jgi:serine protease